MKIILLILLFLHPVFLSFAQEKEESSTSVEQQAENEAEREEAMVEDDSYVQQLTYYKKHPLNMNTAGEEELRLLDIVSELQIGSFFRYKKLMGPLIDVYELQAIPGWDIMVIKRILPYITVGSEERVYETITQRLHNGVNSILLRYGKLFQQTPDTTSVGKYEGSGSSIQFRYKYQYKNLVQWGVTGDKDAGESFFTKAQKKGFDFYSLHFFVQKIKKIRALAIGDYTINMGQGLIQWQNLAFKKSSAVLNIKRQGPVLRPYRSAGEFNFHRGAAISTQYAKWEFTFFASIRKLSANTVIDSLQKKRYVSSFITSGYHRTIAELEDKNRLGMVALGGNLHYKWSNGHIGINSIHYQFLLPIKKEEAPYNLFAICGSKLTNYSIDYSYTHKNIHVFGEAALDSRKQKAFIGGMLASLDSKLDLSVLYRAIDKGYQSMFSNAFTEKTGPNNEKGIYAGISIKPFYGWRVDAYMDLYRFPWLSARVDAPAYGKEYLIQLTYTSSRNLEIYTRLRIGAQPINGPVTASGMRSIIQPVKQNWRIQVNYSPHKNWTMRSRVEIVKYNQSEKGFLAYTDMFYSSSKGRFSTNMRVQYFETDGYNSRIYAFENDLLYNYTIPSFYNKGFHCYVNCKLPIKENHQANKNINLTIWIKIAQTVENYSKRTQSSVTGSDGVSRAEVKVQLFLGCGKNYN